MLDKINLQLTDHATLAAVASAADGGAVYLLRYDLDSNRVLTNSTLSLFIYMHECAKQEGIVENQQLRRV